MQDTGDPIGITLRQVLGGDRTAATDLLPLLYEELRRLAQARLAHLPPGATLQPTALVHEAYLKLVAGGDPGWEGRAHFFGAAAQAMRDILVDQARRKGSLKRGGDGRRLDWAEVELAIEPPSEDMLALDEALTELEKQDERKARVVMLHFFGGLTLDETAAALGVSVPTVKREWRFTRSLLFKRLNEPSPRSG